METRVALDAIGTMTGTDKSAAFGNSHDYLRHYEFFFADYRHHAINLIEIGVMGGNSLKAWKDYFSRAQIVGIDIEPRCQGFREERVDVLIGSQADGAFLNAACAQYPPTIVIDDGSHMAEHIVTTFETVFPLLAPGGVYVVEDLNAHFGEGAHVWQTETIYDAPGYFMQLALARMAKGGNGHSAGPAPSVADVDSVTICGGCVIIRKANVVRDKDAARQAANVYARMHPLEWSAQMRYALHLVEHGGRAERARKLLADVLGKRTTPELLRVHALVEMAAGDAVSAAAALAQADESNTPEGYLRRRLEALRVRIARAQAGC
jgi:hypothetical protein